MQQTPNSLQADFCAQRCYWRRRRPKDQSNLAILVILVFSVTIAVADQMSEGEIARNLAGIKDPRINETIWGSSLFPREKFITDDEIRSLNDEASESLKNSYSNHTGKIAVGGGGLGVVLYKGIRYLMRRKNSTSAQDEENLTDAEV